MSGSRGKSTAAGLKVTSQYHEGVCCGPCFFCGKEQARYDHFIGLAINAQQYLQRHYGSSIPGNSCLCRSHCIEAQRNSNDPQHLPTWKKANKENVPEPDAMLSKCIQVVILLQIMENYHTSRCTSFL